MCTVHVEYCVQLLLFSNLSTNYLTCTIPAFAGIQGVRDEDGFRAPARRRTFAGMTESVVLFSW